MEAAEPFGLFAVGSATTGAGHVAGKGCASVRLVPQEKLSAMVGLARSGPHSAGCSDYGKDARPVVAWMERRSYYAVHHI